MAYPRRQGSVPAARKEGSLRVPTGQDAVLPMPLRSRAGEKREVGEASVPVAAPPERALSGVEQTGSRREGEENRD